MCRGGSLQRMCTYFTLLYVFGIAKKNKVLQYLQTWNFKFNL